jgi:hypothetical protein
MTDAQLTMVGNVNYGPYRRQEGEVGGGVGATLGEMLTRWDPYVVDRSAKMH